jgi:hypothetical protein
VKDVAIPDEITKVTHVCPPVAPITVTKAGFSKVNTGVEAKFLAAFVDGSDDGNAIRAARNAMKKAMKPAAQPKANPSKKRAGSDADDAGDTTSDDDVHLSKRLSKRKAKTTQKQPKEARKKKKAKTTQKQPKEARKKKKVQGKKTESSKRQAAAKGAKPEEGKAGSLVEAESLVENPQAHVLAAQRRLVRKVVALDQPALATASDQAIAAQVDAELTTSEIMGVMQIENGDLMVGIEWEEPQTCHIEVTYITS